jgi:hypothetical protein
MFQICGSLLCSHTYVSCIGKGELQTYWARPRSNTMDASLSASASQGSEEDLLDSKLSRVVSTRHLHESIAFKKELDSARKRTVHWIAEIMVKLLKQIVARRMAGGGQMMKNQHDLLSSRFAIEGMPIDEVVDIITLPRFDFKVAKKQAHLTTVKLPEEVVDQLHNFIAEIALLYNDNPCKWWIS